VSLLLLRDLEWLALILTLTILSIALLAATRPRRHADAEPQREP
jgi:hypothetical protein